MKEMSGLDFLQLAHSDPEKYREIMAKQADEAAVAKLEYAARVESLNKTARELIRLAGDIGLSPGTATKNLGSLLLGEHLGHKLLNGQGPDAEANGHKYEYKTSLTGDNFHFYIKKNPSKLAQAFKRLTAVYFARIDPVEWRIESALRVDARDVYEDLKSRAQERVTYTWNDALRFPSKKRVLRGDVLTDS